MLIWCQRKSELLFFLPQRQNKVLSQHDWKECVSCSLKCSIPFDIRGTGLTHLKLFIEWFLNSPADIFMYDHKIHILKMEKINQQSWKHLKQVYELPFELQEFYYDTMYRLLESEIPSRFNVSIMERLLDALTNLSEKICPAYQPNKPYWHNLQLQEFVWPRNVEIFLQELRNKVISWLSETGYELSLEKSNAESSK